MEQSVRRALREIALAALFCTLFCLVAMSLFAVFVRAYAPADGIVLAVNHTLKGAGAFAFCMAFIRRERAFFKGLAAGALAAVVTMLLFAAIGGGFRLSALFAAELAGCALLGGMGALAGAKLHKE